MVVHAVHVEAEAVLNLVTAFLMRRARMKSTGPQSELTICTAVRDEARALWGAGFLRLAVHEDNVRALAFYRGLGFAPHPGETSLVVARAALDRIGETG